MAKLKRMGWSPGEVLGDDKKKDPRVQVREDFWHIFLDDNQRYYSKPSRVATPKTQHQSPIPYPLTPNPKP